MATRARHMSRIANDKVVLLTTEPIGGGPPMRTIYYVAEEDHSKAEAIIAALTAPNAKAQACRPLPEAAVKALGLKPGDFRARMTLNNQEAISESRLC